MARDSPPRCTSGGTLRRLGGVREDETAIDWQLRLEQWWQAFGHLTIRDLLRRHRSKTEDHRRCTVEWLLTPRELPLEHALELARPSSSCQARTEPDD